ncbi:hypothetical protein U1Q18_009673 [Sarracenia purpurea var. burkii]
MHWGAFRKRRRRPEVRVGWYDDLKKEMVHRLTGVIFLEQPLGKKIKGHVWSMAKQFRLSLNREREEQSGANYRRHLRILLPLRGWNGGVFGFMKDNSEE